MGIIGLASRAGLARSLPSAIFTGPGLTHGDMRSALSVPASLSDILADDIKRQTSYLSGPVEPAFA